MKHFVVIIFIFLTSACLAQSSLGIVAEKFFRTHPFNSKFSTFILNLQRDPWLKIEDLNRRTDSTFFYLKGTYHHFNPFHYETQQVMLIVAEEEIAYSDSLRTHDTIMNLQLIGMIDSSTAIEKTVQKELKRFHNTYSKQFDDFTSRTLKWEDKITGEIISYFVSPFSISPLTIAWGVLPESAQYSFSIILRFKVSENQVIYITQPGELTGL